MKQLTPLFTLLSTTQNRDRLGETLSTLETNLYAVYPKPVRQLLSQTCTTALQEVLLQLLTDCKTTEEKKALFEHLSQEITQLPVVTLTVSFDPPQALLQTIYDYIKHVNPAALVDISVDHRLLAGMTIACNGRYRDFSLRKTLEQYFHKNPIHR